MLGEDLEDYVAFDLETSGLDSGTDKIVSIGWSVVRDDVPVFTKGWVVNPGAMVMPQAASDVNGITQEMINAGRPLAATLKELLDDADGLPLVGHNVLRFDSLFLVAESDTFNGQTYVDTAGSYKAWKLGRLPAVGQSHQDFAYSALSTRAFGLRYNLATCLTTLNVDVTDLTLHSAMDDAIAVQRLFDAMKKADIPFGPLA